MTFGLALTSSIASAALMFFLDPDAGHQRRLRLHHKLRGRVHDFTDFMDVAHRDLKNRTFGFFGDMRYRLKGRKVDDEQLVARVKAKLGRYVSHPKAVDIIAEHGRIVLKGQILRHEAHQAIRAVLMVPGVKNVRSEMTEYDADNQLPILQGGRSRPGDRKDIFQRRWSPATRLLSGAAGTSLAFDGARRSTILGAAEAIVGSVLLARCASNRPVKDLLGFDRPPAHGEEARHGAHIHSLR